MAQHRDLRQVQRSPWPHWTSLRVNTCELLDPSGGRVVRVVCFERLEPGDVTQMSAGYVPRHRNSYDVLAVNLKLPLPDSGLDPVEPIGGHVSLRPECLLWQGGSGMPVPAPITDHVEINIYLHSEGPSGEPMITLDRLAAAVAKLDSDHPGHMRHEHGEYLEPDGTLREALEVCWETVMGRPFAYSDPPRLGVPLTMPMGAYPWYSSSEQPGVHVKPFITIGAMGPSLKLVKLDEGADLDGVMLDGHRFVSVLAGGIRYDGQHVGDLNVIFGSPGDQLGPIVAEQPSLLWVVDWNANGSSVATSWNGWAVR